MPAGPPNRDELRQRLDTLEDQAATIERALFAHLDADLVVQQQAADGQANRLKGALGSRLAALQSTAETQATKLRKNLLKRLGQAYTYAYPYGIIYPTDQHVIYGLETGDIAGSMGLAPVAEIGPPGGTDAIPTPDPPRWDIPPSGIAPCPGINPATGQPWPLGTWGTEACGAAGGPGPGTPSPTVPGSQGSGPCPPGYVWQSAPTVPLDTRGSPIPPPPLSPGWEQPPPPAPSPGVPFPPSGPGSDCVLEVRATLVNEQSDTTVNGESCWRPFTMNPNPPVEQPGWFILGGVEVMHPIPWQPGLPLPQPQDQWEVVLALNHFGAPGGETQVQTGYFAVLRGMKLCMVAADGMLVAAYNCPPFSCPIRDSDRIGWKCPTPPPAPPSIPPPAGGGQCVPAPAGPPGDVCPAPDVPTCGPTFGGQLPQLTGDADDVCKAIAEALDKIRGQNADIAQWFGMNIGTGENESTATQIMRAILGVSNPVLPDLVNRFGAWLQRVLKKANEGLNCEPLTLLPLIINRAVFRLINHWTNAVPTQVLTQIDQLSNTACQALLPTGDEADRAYLMGTIDDAVWKCWTKATGAHVEPAQAVRDAGRTKPNTQQTLRLMMRRLLTADRYDKLIRQNGILTKEDEGDLWDAEQWWPNPSDIIRFLVRDVFDEDVVKRFELDTDFDKKYTEETARWSDGAGVSRELLQYEWRAHWRHIGTGLMLDAFHRLRPGHVPKDLEMTREDLESALKQEDLPPFWIRRLIHLAYTKPTRVDVRRMWELHLLEEKELKERILDLGYDQKTTDKMVEYWQVDRDQKELKKVGYPPPRSMVNAYARGEITRDELRGFAVKVAYYDGQVNEILEAADWARDQATRKLAIAATKRRYTAGLLDRGEAAAELAGVGIDTDQINNLISWWDQIKDKRGREVTAGMLCAWRMAYLIGAGQQLAALIRIGYSPSDANLIVAECSHRMELASQRNTQKAEAAAMKAAAKAAKTEAASMKAKARRTRINTPVSPNGSATGAGGP